MESNLSLTSTARRLDKLQEDLLALNGALQEMLDAQSSMPARRSGSARRPANERLQFRRQALKLVVYAPY